MLGTTSKTILSLTFLLGWCLTSASTLQLQPGWRGTSQILVPCEFDGEMHQCVLDTGAPGSSARPSPALDQYPETEATQRGGLAGTTIPCQKKNVLTLIVADQMLTEFPVAVCASESPGFVVGLDAFADHTLYLSIAKKQISASELEVTSHMASGELGHSPAGHVLLDVKLNSQSRQSAIWDTGANVSTVDQGYAEAHPELFQRIPAPALQATDAAGANISLSFYRLQKLEIGGQVFRNLIVWGTDFSPLRTSVGPETNFIIGFDLIRQVDWWIDFHNRRWRIRQSN